MTPTSQSISTTAPFVRDRFTWISYILFSYYAYMLISMGPIMPFLREELSLDYSTGGFHLSILALAGIPTGLYGDVIVKRFGRHATLWGGGILLTFGVFLLISGKHVLITLAGAGVIGLTGTIIPIIIQAALSDHHLDQRSLALTEVQIAVMISAGIVPLMVGGCEYIGLGWRTGLLIVVGLWLVVAFFFYRLPIPNAPADTAHSEKAQRLPAYYWIYWTIMLLGVAIEWCFSLWGSSFLIAYANVQPAMASTSMSIFFIGMISGRIISRTIVNRFPISLILLVTEAITLLGFLGFWLLPSALFKIIGLCVAGTGIAGFFPLAVAASMNIAPAQSNKASARSSLAAGLAMLFAPLLLAQIADRIGLYWAFGIVIVLLILITGLTLALHGSQRNLNSQTGPGTGR
jgi:MFS family permease